jgi:hypothetical protein
MIRPHSEWKPKERAGQNRCCGQHTKFCRVETELGVDRNFRYTQHYPRCEAMAKAHVITSRTETLSAFHIRGLDRLPALKLPQPASDDPTSHVAPFLEQDRQQQGTSRRFHSMNVTLRLQ